MATVVIVRVRRVSSLKFVRSSIRDFAGSVGCRCGVVRRGMPLSCAGTARSTSVRGMVRFIARSLLNVSRDCVGLMRVVVVVRTSTTAHTFVLRMIALASWHPGPLFLFVDGRQDDGTFPMGSCSASSAAI